MKHVTLSQSRTYPHRLIIVLDLESKEEASEHYDTIKAQLDKGRLSLTFEGVTDKVVRLLSPDEQRGTSCQIDSASSPKK